MPTVKELQELRAPMGAEIKRMAQKLHDEKRADFTAEEKVAWEKVNADFNGLTRQIEIARRADEVGVELGRVGSQLPGAEDTPPKKNGKGNRAAVLEEVRAVAFQAWARRQHGMELNAEQRQAAKAAGLNPNKRLLELRLPRRPDAEQRDLSASTGSAGAYTIPQGFVANLEKALKDYNGPRQVGDVMRTSDGATMPWPTVNDTGNTGELLAENTGVAEADPTYSVVNFAAYKYSSKMVQVPSELLEDSAFDLGRELFELLGERLGRIQATHFTTGTGSSQPQGVVTGSTLGVTTASATAITPDEILGLIHSVDPAYRMDPSFKLMMHDSIFLYVRKLKDANSRWLYEEGRGGKPDQIHGVPVVINQNMSSAVTTGLKTMLAGAFRKFKIRDVNTIRLKRLEERYAEADQVAFIAFMRSDSHVLNAGTNPIKHLIQA